MSVTLITGANKGIGYAAARRLAELGHTAEVSGPAALRVLDTNVAGVVRVTRSPTAPRSWSGWPRWALTGLPAPPRTMAASSAGEAPAGTRTDSGHCFSREEPGHEH